MLPVCTAKVALSKVRGLSLYFLKIQCFNLITRPNFALRWQVSEINSSFKEMLKRKMKRSSMSKLNISERWVRFFVQEYLQGMCDFLVWYSNKKIPFYIRSNEFPLLLCCSFFGFFSVVVFFKTFIEISSSGAISWKKQKIMFPK